MLSATEIASQRATVQSALDVSLPWYRNTPGQDAYGHATESYTLAGTILCNIITPSATQLQLFAEKIGSQRSLIIRVMDTATIKEGDQVAYDGLRWLIQNLQDAESYTVTKEYVMSVVV